MRNWFGSQMYQGICLALRKYNIGLDQRAFVLSMNMYAFLGVLLFQNDKISETEADNFIMSPPDKVISFKIRVPSVQPGRLSIDCTTSHV